MSELEAELNDVKKDADDRVSGAVLEKERAVSLLFSYILILIVGINETGKNRKLTRAQSHTTWRPLPRNFSTRMLF